MKSSEFSEKVAEASTDLIAGLTDIASAYLFTVVVDRLTDEPGDDADLETQNVLDELEMELVIAYADQVNAPASTVAKLVTAFMEAHVRPEKEAIIAEVVANLRSKSMAPKSSPHHMRTDNDTVV